MLAAPLEKVPAVPAGQVRHVAGLVAPCVALAVPAAHVLQVVVPGALQAPVGQQMPATALENLEVAQEKQDTPLGLYFPAKQVPARAKVVLAGRADCQRKHQQPAQREQEMELHIPQKAVRKKISNNSSESENLSEATQEFNLGDSL